jgi:hypothetical protein
VATTAVLTLLPEKLRYPKLGSYSKNVDFTLLYGSGDVEHMVLED